jgi:hypothetical protein
VIRQDETQHCLSIVVIDEETGEQVAIATGVEALVLLVAPDTVSGESYRRVIVGDLESAQSLLLDMLQDVLELSGDGLVFDLSGLFQELLADAIDDLPVH